MRPKPPEHLTGADALLGPPQFSPAPDLLEWVTSTFLEDAGALHNPDHGHLASARLGFLWTNVANARAGRRIIGQAEFRPPSGSMGKWARARAEAQLLGWFAEPLDFLITLDADYAATCSDTEFLALIEHELHHCGQARDEYGAPKFAKDGSPAFAIKAHDIEEFIGVVARYGITNPQIAALIEAAQSAPEISGERIAVSCGTCG